MKIKDVKWSCPDKCSPPEPEQRLPEVVASDSVRELEDTIDRRVDDSNPPVIPHPVGIEAPKPEWVDWRIPRYDLKSSKSAATIADTILSAARSAGIQLACEDPKGDQWSPLYAYWGGYWRQLPGSWLHEQMRAYDGAVTSQQKGAEKGKNRGGIPDNEKWHANPRNLGAVNTLLRSSLLSEWNLPAGESPLSYRRPAATVFRNGTLCWSDEEGRMRWERHSSSHRAKWRFEFDYQPGQTPEHVLRCLEYSFRDCGKAERSKRIEVMRAMAGVAFLGVYQQLKRSLWLVGRGNDGKGLYTDLINAMMPEPGVVSSTPPSAFGNKATGDMYRKLVMQSRVNMCHELKKLDVGIEDLKSMLVCEPMNVRSRGGDPKMQQPQCLTIADCNYPMPRTEVDSAWWRRWVIIHFGAPIHPDAPTDKDAVRKLALLDGPAFVCWAVDGALDLLSRRCRFDLPDCNIEKMAEWSANASNDNVSEYIQTQMGSTEGPKTKLPKLRDVYGRPRQDKATGRVVAWEPAGCYRWWLSEYGYAPSSAAPYGQFRASLEAMRGVQVLVRKNQYVVSVDATHGPTRTVEKPDNRPPIEHAIDLGRPLEPAPCPLSRVTDAPRSFRSESDDYSGKKTQPKPDEWDGEFDDCLDV